MTDRDIDDLLLDERTRREEAERLLIPMFVLGVLVAVSIYIFWKYL